MAADRGGGYTDVDWGNLARIWLVSDLPGPDSCLSRLAMSRPARTRLGPPRPGLGSPSLESPGLESPGLGSPGLGSPGRDAACLDSPCADPPGLLWTRPVPVGPGGGGAVARAVPVSRQLGPVMPTRLGQGAVSAFSAAVSCAVSTGSVISSVVLSSLLRMVPTIRQAPSTTVPVIILSVSRSWALA